MTGDKNLKKTDDCDEVQCLCFHPALYFALAYMNEGSVETLGFKDPISTGVV